MPETHAWPAAQTVEQPPQCAGSLLSFTHAPPQNVWFGGHVHAPATQLSPEGQAIPQALQLFGSVLRLTQVPLQLVRPDWQVSPHMPREQTWPAGHALPHVPQFLLSFCALTQTPLQFVSPIWHESVHTPPALQVESGPKPPAAVHCAVVVQLPFWNTPTGPVGEAQVLVT